MNLLFRWCFLALMTISFVGCETDDEEEDINQTKSTEPIIFEATANWSQSGGYARSEDESYRADHYKFSVNADSPLNVTLSCQVPVEFWLRKNGVLKDFGIGTAINKMKTIEEGSYELVVHPSLSRIVDTLSYNLKINGVITLPYLVQARTEILTNQELPADSANPSRAAGVFYSIKIGANNELDAADIILQNSSMLNLYYYTDRGWQPASPTPTSFLWKNLTPEETYYFRVGPQNSMIPPKAKYDLSVNARSFTLTSHGTKDPT